MTSLSVTSGSTNAYISFTLPSKKGDCQKDYQFPTNLLDSTDSETINEIGKTIGKGQSGTVISLPITVSYTRNQLKIDEKVKNYAVKKFHIWIDGTNEHFSHQCIIEKIRLHADKLKELGIVPGIGIEKQPLHFFEHSIDGDFLQDEYLVKQLYIMDLWDAVRKSVIKPKHLVSGSLQLIQGLITLKTIGALYFDIKPDNILVGRKKKLEIVFTDFEEVKFLNFNESDKETLKSVFIKMPKYLANIRELAYLTGMQKEHGGTTDEFDVDKFLQILHKLYVFMMGVLFFEMTTTINLYTLSELPNFSTYLDNKDALAVLIDEFSRDPDSVSEKSLKELEELSKGLKENNTFTDGMKEMLSKTMISCKAPKAYADLVISMLNPFSDKRIDLSTVHRTLKKIWQDSRNVNGTHHKPETKEAD